MKLTVSDSFVKLVRFPRVCHARMLLLGIHNAWCNRFPLKTCGNDTLFGIEKNVTGTAMEHESGNLIAASLLFALLLLVAFRSVNADETANHSANALKNHVKYLASDELEGRGTGTQGNRKAAKYIATFFKKHGIAPVDGSYFQQFTVTTQVRLGKDNKAEFRNSGKITKWKLDKDYRPMPFSRNGTVTAGVVFAGYGITAPEQDFDEYAGIDAGGKVIIVLRSAPNYQAEDAKFDNYASLFYKYRNAIKHGAVGIIYVSPSNMSDELFRLSLMRGGRDGGIVALHVRRQVLKKILPDDQSLTRLENEIAETLKPHSFEIPGGQIHISSTLKFIEEPTANVVGLVRGSDPNLADETIVVGAHFDHVGYGDRGASRYRGPERRIHPGADDNASGSASMMEIGAKIAAAPLPRSVLFIGFSGEEMGLLGSRFYTENPLLPLQNTVTMINLDMVGRITDDVIRITGTGTSPQWSSLVDSLGKTHQLSVAKTPGGLGPSDHASFYRKNIPVINFFSGLHKDYHRPSDTWDKINYPGMAKVVDFAVDALREIGSYRERPVFVQVDAESQPPKVFLGVTPDESPDARGLKIARVVPGSSADKAGMQAGDILKKIDEARIADFEELIAALQKYTPADSAKITILRGSAPSEITLEVTFQARQ